MVRASVFNLKVGDWNPELCHLDISLGITFAPHCIFYLFNNQVVLWVLANIMPALLPID